MPRVECPKSGMSLTLEKIEVNGIKDRYRTVCLDFSKAKELENRGLTIGEEPKDKISETTSHYVYGTSDEWRAAGCVFFP